MYRIGDQYRFTAPSTSAVSDEDTAKPNSPSILSFEIKSISNTGILQFKISSSLQPLSPQLRPTPQPQLKPPPSPWDYDRQGHFAHPSQSSFTAPPKSASNITWETLKNNSNHYATENLASESALRGVAYYTWELNSLYQYERISHVSERFIPPR